jgi:hypothetical protein
VGGRPSSAAEISLCPATPTPPIGQWVIGLPLSWLLAFPLGWGAPGLWAGLVAGAALQAAVLLVMLSRWDWAREAQRVTRRMAAAAAARGEAEGGGGGGGGLAPAH